MLTKAVQQRAAEAEAESKTQQARGAPELASLPARVLLGHARDECQRAVRSLLASAAAVSLLGRGQNEDGALALCTALSQKDGGKGRVSSAAFLLDALEDCAKAKGAGVASKVARKLVLDVVLGEDVSAAHVADATARVAAEI